MNVLEAVLDRRRLVLTVALLLAVTGVAAWATMVRREDPVMPAYWGQVVVSFPGADAEMVERLVVEPVEDALAEVEEIHVVKSTAWAETAVLAVDLDEGTADTDAAWDEVRRALRTARREFPEGVGEPVLNSKMSTDHDSVVVAVTGSPDPVVLLAAARVLREGLLDVRDVARVKIIGDPGEQVTVELDDSSARRLGLTPQLLAAQLSARTRILPGGSLAVGERTLRLRPLAELETVQEIAATPVRLPSGATVPLGEVAAVRLGPREPATQRMRLDGEMAVGVAVVAKERSNSVRFGDAVRERLDEISPELAPLTVHTIAFQPERVAGRLSQLNRSLLLGILIVAGVVILAMGFRLGLVVAAVVPLVTFAALAVFAAGGGVLHQISIAALVLALGMLVDNAIVVAENVQRRLDLGEERRQAAVAAVRELAAPLAAATLTTVAAFIPMLLAEGGTGEFTRSIPVMLILALSISYLFAVFVTPALAVSALVPGTSRAVAATEALGRRLADLALRRSGIVLAAVGALVAASLVASGWVRQEFFPAADRNQLVVDVKLPEGAHMDSTDAAARTLERALLGRREVTQVASFVGRSAPRFYYNIQSVPWSPHFAQLMVTTRTMGDVEPVLEWLRDAAPRLAPAAEVTGRRLEQGPPVGAPVEVRLLGDDLASLSEAATAVAGVLRDAPGAVDVRHDLGPGEPTLRFVIDDAAAARHGLSRADVARALYGHTRGLPVGELRSSDDPVPVVIRSAAGEHLPVQALDGLDVTDATGVAVPLAQVVRVEPAWQPAAINHRNRERVATVSSQLAAGATYSEVLESARPRLDALSLPAGIRIAYGGEAEGSGEANTALLRNLPLGLLLLLGVLLAEFNSFRRVAIILVTVPLAATGVIPGLLIAGQPFGFMSMLGVFALVGIVVNNAIVLLEVVEQRRRGGAGVDEALHDAVLRRIRPILLTTATTVCGLLPLALSPSTLWPPLAWAMISGLLASTMLTLVVVPALYRVLLGRPAGRLRRLTAAVPRAAAVLVVLGSGIAAAQPLPVDLETAVRRGMERPAAEAARLRARAASEAARAERRVATLPNLAVTASVSERDRELELVTPIGSFPFGDARTESAAVRVSQPLLDPSRLLYANPATRAEEAAAELSARRTRVELGAEAAAAYLDVLAVDAQRRATRAFVRSLEARLEEMQSRVDAGRSLEADALKMRLALEEAELDLAALGERRDVALLALQRALGEPGDLAVLPAPDWVGRPAADRESLVESALAARSDLASLDRSLEATEQRRRAVTAERIPRLDAVATWTWTSGSPYAEDQWVEGAVVLAWSPLASGTRGPRAAALDAAGDALQRDLAEARSGVRLQVRSALAELEVARDGVQVARRGVEYARETLRVEAERHAAGRATTNDLLDAESALRRQRTRQDVAELEVVRAWVRLWLAVGEGGVETLMADGP